MSDTWDPEPSDFTDYDGEVITAHFQTSEFNGRVELELTLLTDDPAMAEWHERYSVGMTKKGGAWLVVDEGRRIESTDGTVRVRDNANMGKLITKAVKLAGKDLTSRGEATDAEVWIGTKWHWSQEKGSFTDKETGEKRTWARNFPSAFLGS